jgi:hypothetical protein
VEADVVEPEAVEVGLDVVVGVGVPLVGVGLDEVGLVEAEPDELGLDEAGLDGAELDEVGLDDVEPVDVVLVGVVAPVGSVVAVGFGAERRDGVGAGVAVACVAAAEASAVRVLACAEAVPARAVRSVDTTSTVPPRRRPLPMRAPVAAAGSDAENTGTLTKGFDGLDRGTAGLPGRWGFPDAPATVTLRSR